MNCCKTCQAILPAYPAASFEDPCPECGGGIFQPPKQTSPRVLSKRRTPLSGRVHLSGGAAPTKKRQP